MKKVVNEKVLIHCVHLGLKRKGVNSDNISLERFDEIKYNLRNKIYDEFNIWVSLKSYKIPNSMKI